MEYYSCDICGNIATSKCDCVEFECCNQPMKHLIPNVDDTASKEKHVPVYMLDDDNTICIRVGEVMHPSEEKHYIKWLALVTNNGYYSKEFNPEEKPVACFILEPEEKIEAIYAYCNLHGLWKTK